MYIGRWQTLILESVHLGYGLPVIYSLLKINVAHCDILNAYFRRKYHSISSEKIKLVFGKEVYKFQLIIGLVFVLEKLSIKSVYNCL